MLNKALLGGAAPAWALKGASLDMDFANGRAFAQGGGNAFTALLTTTRASTGYAQTSSGLLVSFGANVPRITDLGLLVEQAATNIKTQSQTFETSWPNFHSSITAAATTAPDGTTTGEKLVEDNQNNVHQIHQNSSKAASALVYAATIYAKQAGRTRLMLQLSDNGGNGVLAGYDLAGGQVAYGPTNVGTPFTSATASIASLANGWYRLTIIATSNTATSIDLQINLDNGSGTAASSTSYAGDGASGVYIWGAQVEQNSFATSYIPTTSASATRAADSISLTNSAIIGLSAGTFRFDMGAVPWGADGLDHSLLSFSSASSTPGMGRYSGGFLQLNDGVGYRSAQTYTSGLAFKYAVTYGGTRIASSLNGGSVSTYSSFSPPISGTGTPYKIGSVSGAPWNGTFKRITYLPNTVADGALQGLAQ